MNTPTTAVTRTLTKMLAGRDFTSFFSGRIEIRSVPEYRERLQITIGENRDSLFVADQIIDVNQGDRPEPLVLPFLDARRSVTVSTRVQLREAEVR